MGASAVGADDARELADVVAEEFRELGVDPRAAVDAWDAAAAAGPDGDSAIDGPVAPTALCLSGGGIRSATFSLGVLQGLAKLGLLNRFTYLSTVSGGGYIGSWLATWISRDGNSLDSVSNKLGGRVDPHNTSDPSEPAGPPGPSYPYGLGARMSAGTVEPEPIRHLRAYSNFLSPVSGLSADFVALISIFFRNLLLHWLCVIPVLLAVLLLPRFLVAAILLKASLTAPIQAAMLAAVLILTAVAGMKATLEAIWSPEGSRHWMMQRSVFMLFVLPLLIVSFLTVLLGLATAPVTIHYMLAAAPAGFVLGAIAAIFTKDARQSGRFEGKRVRLIIAAIATAAAGGAVVGCGFWLIRRGAAGAGWAPGLSAADSLSVAKLMTTLGPVVVLVTIWLGAVALSGFIRRTRTELDREWWGRASGMFLLWGAVWLLLAFVVIYVPVWLLGTPFMLKATSSGLLASLGIFFATAIAAIGFWSKQGPTLTEKTRKVASALGLKILDVVAAIAIAIIAVMMVVATSVVLYRLSVSQDTGSAVSTYLMGASDCQGPVRGMPLNECLASPKYGEGHCDNANLMAGLVPSFSLGGGNAERAWQCETLWHASGVTLQQKNRLLSCCQNEIAIPNPPAALGLIARHGQSLSAPGLPYLLVALVVLVGVSVLASLFIGVNGFSMSAMYGNRLARAYIGASNPTRTQHPFTGFDPQDNDRLASLRPGTRAGGRLYPVFNAAINLTQRSGGRLEWQQRKAASFIMTPSHCGSEPTGFAPTPNFGGSEGGISIARAMAASGAAASPNMGYHSSALVTLLMALFNVRLGWWMPNPRHKAGWKRDEPPLPICEILKELTSATGDSSNFVSISDGGHFENLGLYEMVRRRCRTIVVVDAGCDPCYRYADIENAIRKIRSDFSVPIDLLGPLPDPAAGGAHYYFEAKIRYSDVDRRQAGEQQEDEPVADGRIIFIKPILTGEEPIDLRNYAEASRNSRGAFPQQPTSDQFFDESQFESYRKLGYLAATHTFRDKRWPDGDRPSKRDEPGSCVAGSSTPASTVSVHGAGGSAGDSAGSSVPVGLLDGLARSFNSLGPMAQSLMMASAVSLTAAITVTGAVTLSNPEVRLAGDQSISIKPGAAPFEVSLGNPPELRLAPNQSVRLQTGESDPRDVQPALIALVEQLRREVDRLQAVSPQSDAARDLAASAAALSAAARTLGRSASALSRGTADTREVLASLSSVVRSFQQRLTDIDGIITALDFRGVLTSLERISGKLDEISPRSNVRSTR